MKTYVVEETLCDYTCGAIVVKAENVDEAIKLILKEFNDYNLYNDGYNDPPNINKNKKYLKSKIRELKDNEVLCIWGGE